MKFGSYWYSGSVDGKTDEARYQQRIFICVPNFILKSIPNIDCLVKF